MENKKGFEFLQRTRNQFRNHCNLFFQDKITLQQLISLTFAWVIQHEDLYREKPLPTEPNQYYGTTDADFAEVMKSWHLGCGSLELENKSNKRCLNRAKKFFLINNLYDDGMELFNKYAEPEVVPF